MAEICPTLHTENLLLATDGSQFSEGAIREAIRLAKQCSSKLSAVTVIETNAEFETIAPQLLERSEKAAREHLESVKARAKKEGIDCTISILEGEGSYNFIASEAVKSKASMIVMGRRGAEIISLVVEDGETYARLKAHPRRVCAPDIPIPFSPPLERYVAPDRKKLTLAIRDVIKGVSGPCIDQRRFDV